MSLSACVFGGECKGPEKDREGTGTEPDTVCMCPVVVNLHVHSQLKALGTPQQRIVNRHGHHRRHSHFSSTAETRKSRSNTAVARRAERESQWQNRHVEQHRVAELFSKAGRLKAIWNQWPHPMRRQQRQGMIPTLHVRLAICGCERGPTRERRCLSALRALTNLTSAPMQLLVALRSSGHFRRH